MEAIAKLNKLRTSPRKVRLVVDLVRGMSVEKALHVLQYTQKGSAKEIATLLKSAAANLRQKKKEAGLSNDQVYIKQIYANSAGMFKRIKPAPRGSAHKIRKRLSHITVHVGQAASPSTSEGKKRIKKNVKTTEQRATKQQ